MSLGVIIRHVFAPEGNATEAGIVAARARFAGRTVEFVGKAEFAVSTPLGGSPTRIHEPGAKGGVDAGVVVEGLLFPGLTVVIAVEHHAIAPSAVDDEGEAVVFGGLHPVVVVGAPVGAALFEVGKDHLGLVPSLAVRRTPVQGRDGAVVKVAAEDVDDVAVGARGHHGRVCVRTVVGVKGGRDAVGRYVVLVLDDVNANVSAGVGNNDDAVLAIAGDGAESGLLALDAAAAGNPFVVYGIVGADTGATVAEAAIGGHGVGEVHFAVGPSDRPRAGALVRLPVIGGVVQFALTEVQAGHVGLALHVFKGVPSFQSGSFLHRGNFVLRFLVGNVSHLRVTGNGHHQDQC